MIYKVVLISSDWSIEQKKRIKVNKTFTFTEYDEVETFINCMVDGADELDIKIIREETKA